ncbi:L-histidine N(alpha)-methyltransferase [Pedobacter sp. Leaf176]|uniref:L-histidine N(alpha)-methyltransferase n=1 Tax=Pedobacter sp. Leaf176 TaxID=1736286 RepID=UPI0006FA993F|nr:L-histidine N(alpha)-methyltransferase [Pedobacter sp. Leaf176]KQR67361.1 dimethylhistidine N-methyltransferase [Pedobacter sp. Leaf176]
MMLSTEKTAISSTQFLQETLEGLHAEPKRMYSKYFYDETGDQIFQQIMAMEEYYLTDAEMEIMKDQADGIADAISTDGTGFDLIELGAGDATKSIHLLRKLLEKKHDFKYYPIDISEHVIEELSAGLPVKLPLLNFQGLNGDYFDMLRKACEISDRKKVVLFMGANIGNMSVGEAQQFCINLKDILSPEDILIIGFDLKKNPKQILDAYNDKSGITRSFNLNLLNRINRELNGTFDLDAFDHYASYDPETGSCKSYLISLKNQLVHIDDAEVSFSKDEYIYMEISQKYSLSEIEDLADSSGFKVVQYFSDRRQYFVDAVWKFA